MSEDNLSQQDTASLIEYEEGVTEGDVTAATVSVPDDENVSVPDIIVDNSEPICLEPTLQKFDIVDIHETYSNMTRKKKTTPYLTNYEKTLLVGIRRQHIASGAEPMIDYQKKNLYTVNEIVDEELRRKKIPLIIRRYLPNQTYEDWKLEDLHYTV